MSNQKTRTFYHVIEESGYGNIGTHGWYATLEEAEAEVKRRQNFFPNLYFYVFPSNSKREPEFVTL